MRPAVPGHRWFEAAAAADGCSPGQAQARPGAGSVGRGTIGTTYPALARQGSAPIEEGQGRSRQASGVPCCPYGSGRQLSAMRVAKVPAHLPHPCIRPALDLAFTVIGPDLRPVSHRLAHRRQPAPPIQARTKPTGHVRLAASRRRQQPAEELPAAYAHPRRRPLTPLPARASWPRAREPRRHGVGPLPAARWRRPGPYRRAGVFSSVPQAAHGRRQADR